MNENPRKEALSSALSRIEKQFGTGSIMRLGDRPPVDIETFGSGSIAIDEAL